MEPNDADCDPDSLRSRGWLQGCTLRLPLPLRHTAVVDGTVEEVVRTHDLWLIAEQDCDLAWRAVLREGAEQFLVELRPVFTDDPPVDWGIRSQRFLLSADDGRHLLATAPVVRVTPQVIVTAEHVACLDDDHQLRLKTWMGLRYDRPAVPQRYMKLARVLADALSVKKNRSRAERYRDVLAQYWDEDGVTKFTLVAVLPGGPHAANSNEVVDARAWLAESVRDVPAELGVAVSLDAYGDDTISLQYSGRLLQRRCHPTELAAEQARPDRRDVSRPVSTVPSKLNAPVGGVRVMVRRATHYRRLCEWRSKAPT